MKKFVQKIATFWDQQKEIPTSYPFVMYDEEKDLLKKTLKSSKHYLEFGSGGSTLFALINSTAEIISVDTNLPWLNFLKKYKIVRNNLNQRLFIHFVDIGPTKFWGYPVDDSHTEKFENLSSDIFSQMDVSKIDTILIDGRFRVACAMMSILKCHANPNLKILIHDYSIRDTYSIVENFLEISDFSKTLYSFRIKNDINMSEVNNYYEQYKYIAD